MKKILSIILCVAMVMLTLSMTSCSNNANKVTINVFNWGENISDGQDGSMDVIKEFEKQTGIDVVYSTYESNEAMYNKIKTGGVNYDVIIPSDYMIGKMISEGMLHKLDYNNIPNYALIDDEFKKSENMPFDPTLEYCVPYTWGRVALVYNTKKVTEPVDSWSILWDEKYKNQILMFDNARDAFGIAQLKLGYSLNTEDETELKNAAEELKKQRTVKPVYAMDQIMEKMPSENAYVAPYYLGDCLTMCDDNEDLAMVIPKEGTNYFVDAMCIPATSEHKAEAEAFINFMCGTEAASANIQYIAYSSPQKEAAANHKKYLIEEYGEETAQLVYPTDLSNTEMFLTLSPEANQLMTDLWITVRSGN